MEQQPPPSSTPPPRPAPPPPPLGAGAAAPSDGAPASPAAPASVALICPVCGVPRAEDARFCEECGHDYGGQPPPLPTPAEERSRLSGPVLWVVVALWAALAVGGLVFLFNALWSL